MHWLLCVRGATWDSKVSSPLSERHRDEQVNRALERLGGCVGLAGLELQGGNYGGQETCLATYYDIFVQGDP